MTEVKKKKKNDWKSFFFYGIVNWSEKLGVLLLETWFLKLFSLMLDFIPDFFFFFIHADHTFERNHFAPFHLLQKNHHFGLGNYKLSKRLSTHQVTIFTFLDHYKSKQFHWQYIFFLMDNKKGKKKQLPPMLPRCVWRNGYLSEEMESANQVQIVDDTVFHFAPMLSERVWIHFILPAIRADWVL